MVIIQVPWEKDRLVYITNNSNNPPRYETGILRAYKGRDYHSVVINNGAKWAEALEMSKWCQETFGIKDFNDEGDHWFSSGSIFHFSNESWRTAFILRWV